ncbi:MAG: hypothetical protein ACT4O9_11285 [Blastocatellia bacterium]
MIRHWTRFNGKPNHSNRDKVRITLNWKSSLMLNRTAFEAIGRPAAVELMFDRTYGIIGVMPIRTDAHNAFPVKPVLKGSYRRINAASFCLNFEICVEKTVMFLEPFINPDGVLELNLAKTMLVTRGSR